MSLDKEILRVKLSRFMDPQSDAWKEEIDNEFGSYPRNSQEFGEKWADAISAYLYTPPASTISPDVVILPNLVPFQALITALSRGLRPARPNPPMIPTETMFRETFNIAFRTLGTAIGTLMQSNAGGNAVFSPPPGRLGDQIISVVKSVQFDFTISQSQKSTETVRRITDVIDRWFRAGTFNGNNWS